jgi:hypothetical protein
MFENGYKENKDFFYNNYKVQTKLFLKTNNIASIPEKYKNYWFDSFNEFENKIKVKF